MKQNFCLPGDLDGLEKSAAAIAEHHRLAGPFDSLKVQLVAGLAQSDECAPRVVQSQQNSLKLHFPVAVCKVYFRTLSGQNFAAKGSKTT